MLKLSHALFTAMCIILCNLSTASETATSPASARGVEGQQIKPYTPRTGRSRPVVAVIGDNAGTELTDFVIPYGVIARSNIAEVVAVATRAGPIQMTPATVKIDAHTTIGQFDARFPDGADYVIVPKVSNSKDPLLLQWIVAQHRKGATVVSTAAPMPAPPASAPPRTRAGQRPHRCAESAGG